MRNDTSTVAVSATIVTTVAETGNSSSSRRLPWIRHRAVTVVGSAMPMIMDGRTGPGKGIARRTATF